MPAIDEKIDDLYKGPLENFIPARAELAKTLSGADAQRVKKLAKPTIVPWAVNQVYWRARPTWDRLTKSGEKLRSAQIAALKGKSADVRAATDAQRSAIRDAVAAATKFASAAGASPGADALMRTFEAVSLATDLPEPPGRLTRPLQPAGFEALSGVSIPAHVVTKGREPKVAARGQVAGRDLRLQPSPGADRRVRDQAERDARAERERMRREREDAAAARRRERELAAAAREHNKAIAKAEGVLERARTAEARARKAWELAKQEAEDAEAALSRTKSRV